MIVASRVSVVVATSAVLAKKARIETALVVSSAPWSITFSTSSGPMHRRRHLHAAGAPAIGHRHFARGERDLIAGNRDRLQDRAADHALGLLVEIGEIVGAGGHSAACGRGGAMLRPTGIPPPPRLSPSRRNCRSSASSAWKST